MKLKRKKLISYQECTPKGIYRFKRDGGVKGRPASVHTPRARSNLKTDERKIPHLEGLSNGMSHGWILYALVSGGALGSLDDGTGWVIRCPRAGQWLTSDFGAGGGVSSRYGVSGSRLI